MIMAAWIRYTFPRSTYGCPILCCITSKFPPNVAHWLEGSGLAPSNHLHNCPNGRDMRSGLGMVGGGEGA